MSDYMLDEPERDVEPVAHEGCPPASGCTTCWPPTTCLGCGTHIAVDADGVGQQETLCGFHCAGCCDCDAAAKADALLDAERDGEPEDEETEEQDIAW